MGKKLLIAGYPKSGNTWLGYMLSYILGAKYIDLESPDEKVTLQKEILELIDGSVPQKTDYERVCKTHRRYHFLQDPADSFDLEAYDKVIVIVRDPRDVAVSYYFYKYYNVPIALNRPEDMLSNKSWAVRSLYWKKHVKQTARDWMFHTVSWQTFEGTFLVRYEDFKKDCLGSLRRICEYLGVHCEESILQEAVSLFSFEKLSGGRKAGTEYATAFFRKGIIGDYKNHFDVVDAFVMRRYAGKEMKILGYK